MATPGAPMADEVAAATRRSLHAVAEQVLARFRWDHEGRIGLVATPRGMATPPVTGPRGATRLSVEGVELVVSVGDRAERHQLTTLRAAASAAGVEPAPPPSYAPATGVGPDEPLVVDPAVAGQLAAWWWRSWQALAGVAARHAGRFAAPEPTLWPEHFDLAVTAAAPRFGADGVVNLGVSAGDDHHPGPYAYVGPWPVPGRWDDPWWDAPFGRSVPAGQLDGDGALAALFEEGLRRTA